MTRPAAEEIANRFIGGEQQTYLADQINDAIRAAIEERDRGWAKALLPVAVCVECNEAFGFAPFVRPECRYCAPLRALLSGAARSADKEAGS